MTLKRFSTWAVALLALSAFTISLNAAAPERPFINSISIGQSSDTPPHPFVFISWKAPSTPPVSYEIQRKLFLFGWRVKAHLVGANVAWADTKPAKRVAHYRMRALSPDGTSKWSNTVHIDP